MTPAVAMMVAYTWFLVLLVLGGMRLRASRSDEWIEADDKAQAEALAKLKR